MSKGIKVNFGKSQPLVFYQNSHGIIWWLLVGWWWRPIVYAGRYLLAKGNNKRSFRVITRGVDDK